jgi:hypothetical protein
MSPNRTKAEIKARSERLSLKSTPWDWLKKAQALRQASDYLFVRFEDEQLAYDEQFERTASFELEPPDDSVLMMLLGFAIENLLKGLYVSTLREAKAPRALKDLDLPGHDLVEIANMVGVVLNERESAILAALRESILWYGRYPSPTHVDKLISTRDDKLFLAPQLRYPEHLDACALYVRLESLLVRCAPYSIKQVMGVTVRVGRMPGDAGGSERA